MYAEGHAENRASLSPYAVGILVGVLFWLTGCNSLQKQQGEKTPPSDPFYQSNAASAVQPPPGVKSTKTDAVASAAVPAPKPGTVTSAAVPAPRPGPTMAAGGSTAKLMPPDTLSPGTATLVNGTTTSMNNDGKPSAVLQPPLQHADWQGGGQTLTLEEANRLLQTRGVTSQKLERRGGKVYFSCEIPKASDPNVIKFYEAEADKEIDAMQAVLTQIDQDQPRK